jgi:glycerol-3-phosphate O-acyltransferase/dihydroxyacetone phosphate acyltransferase
MLLLAALPTILLNFPVGIIARLYANRRRKAALANSKVKVKGLDVVLSEKVVICIVLVPTLWFAYGLALKLFTNLDGPSIALIIMSLPLCSYMGIVVAQAGMVGLKDLRPYVMRLFPSARRRLAALPATRKELQEDLREFIRELGPSLGEIYYGKVLDWAAIKEESRSTLSKAATGEPTPNDDKKEK